MRVFSSLYAQLAAVLLLLFLAIGALVLALTLRGAERHFDQVQLRLNRDVAGHIAKSMEPFSGDDVDRKALQGLFMDVMTINPSLEVYLIDPRGAVLAYDAPEEKIQRRRVALEPVRRFLEEGGTDLVLGDDPRSLDRTKPFTCHPLERDGELRGYVYIVLGGEISESVADALRGRTLLGLSPWLLIGGLALSAGAGLAAFAVITRPLRRLHRAMAAYRDGELPQPVDVHGSAEVVELSQAFNRMGERIAAQVRVLRQTDERRREILANVSHDLRTPAAAVQGYIETLLVREERLQSEERQQYLQRALRQCQRLGKLVDQLFELARFDARQIVPEKEPFSLAELVQDIAHKFTREAEERGIALSVQLEPDLPPVEADIGLIERALDNLIENALRFTPPGGRVALSLYGADESVGFRIRDTGCGIPAEETERIFDRFHRGAGRRESSEQGAGLGLAIAQRILDLHEGRIEVESEVGEGTSFSFALPSGA